MVSLISSLVTMALSFRFPTIVKFTSNNNNKTMFFSEIPDDPSLSCYLLENGLWKCVSDTQYKVDPDSSY